MLGWAIVAPFLVARLPALVPPTLLDGAAADPISALCNGTLKMLLRIPYKNACIYLTMLFKTT